MWLMMRLPALRPTRIVPQVDLFDRRCLFFVLLASYDLRYSQGHLMEGREYFEATRERLARSSGTLLPLAGPSAS
ncbi:hypothetical protein ARMSODRAFT_966848 [Armillaria solidipes]|uniref:Uncharacterized protein n=1 Tax=Armillaria solidipes TaxID=1076256 RepID=A0A2H3AKM6_9AGAR|nr:hypothetical protein ARMSODRAFT_966848 [Armillaria solidipes]